MVLCGAFLDSSYFHSIPFVNKDTADTLVWIQLSIKDLFLQKKKKKKFN
jgi:hypothetical protein